MRLLIGRILAALFGVQLTTKDLTSDLYDDTTGEVKPRGLARGIINLRSNMEMMNLKLWVIIALVGSGHPALVHIFQSNPELQTASATGVAALIVYVVLKGVVF